MILLTKEDVLKDCTTEISSMGVCVDIIHDFDIGKKESSKSKLSKVM